MPILRSNLVQVDSLWISIQCLTKCVDDMVGENRKAARLNPSIPTWVESFSFDCPHCEREQVIPRLLFDAGAVKLSIAQCLACLKLTIIGRFNNELGVTVEVQRLFPTSKIKPPMVFEYAPAEVLRAYEDACGLIGIHTGAAGAYSRRCLELLLDGYGYQAKSLDDAIKAARFETDVDKRLPRRLLDKLNHVRECGNFALHVRRDNELAIVDVGPEEVEYSLVAVEELISFIYEEPAQDYEQALEMNKKLIAAGKKPLGLADPPKGYKAPGEPPT